MSWNLIEAVVLLTVAVIRKISFSGVEMFIYHLAFFCHKIDEQGSWNGMSTVQLEI